MSHYDEQPDGDPHGECAAEIARLTALVEELQADRKSRNAGVPEGAVSMTSPKLLEAFAERAGMVNLLNHGAASCVHSEGCHGVTQAHLTKYTEIVAAYCVQAMAEMIGAPNVPAGDPGDADKRRMEWLAKHYASANFQPEQFDLPDGVLLMILGPVGMSVSADLRGTVDEALKADEGRVA